MKRKPAATATAERREIVKSFQREAEKLREEGKSRKVLGEQWVLAQRADLYDYLAGQIRDGQF